MTGKAHSQGLSDRALKRLLIGGVVLLAVVVAAFGVTYYFGQHVSAGPSLADRTVTGVEKQVKKQPSDIGLRLALAAAYQADNRQNDALTQYSQVIKFVPNQAVALLSRGQIYLNEKDYANAAKDFNTIIGLAGSDQTTASVQIEAAHYFLAQIAFAQGKSDTAMDQARKALSMDSTDSDAWYLVGQVSLQKKQPKAAVAAFVRGLSFVPTGWCDPYAGLITAYTQLKNTDQVAYYTASQALCKSDATGAAKQYEKLVGTSVGFSAMLQLGAINESQGDLHAALAWYQKALAAHPSDKAAKASVVRLQKLITTNGTN